jgi:hypothetical protein
MQQMKETIPAKVSSNTPTRAGHIGRACNNKLSVAALKISVEVYPAEANFSTLVSLNTSISSGDSLVAKTPLTSSQLRLHSSSRFIARRFAGVSVSLVDGAFLFKVVDGAFLFKVVDGAFLFKPDPRKMSKS